MNLRGKKLGILISVPPGQPGFRHGIGLAATARAAGVEVYLYCIDQAVAGLEAPELQALKNDGLKLYACAFGAQRLDLPLRDQAVFAGLTVVSELIASTDRFVSFN